MVARLQGWEVVFTGDPVSLARGNICPSEVSNFATRDASKAPTCTLFGKCHSPDTHDAHHEKTDLKVFVVVIPKEGFESFDFIDHIL